MYEYRPFDMRPFLHYLIRIFTLLFFAIAITNTTKVLAQDHATQLALARQFILSNEHSKAIPIFDQLYQKAPFDKSLYNEYLNALLATKNYTQAHVLLTSMKRIRPKDFTVMADEAYVFDLEGKKKEAKILWDQVLDGAARDPYQLNLVAASLKNRSLNDKAIELYEGARKKMLNPKMYAQELALLYLAKGDKSKALAASLDNVDQQTQVSDDLKSTLAAIIDSDAKLSSQLDKELKKRLSETPSNNLMELLVWQSLNSNNPEQAIIEIEKLDILNTSNGYLLLQLAYMLFQNGNQSEALSALHKAEGLNKSQSLSKEILSYKTLIMQQILDTKKPVDIAMAKNLKQVYESLFDKFPAYSTAHFYLNYVRLRALSLHELDTAIVLLKEFIAIPQLRKDVRGKATIDLGDYYLMQGEQWESTLYYAQVDKANKEDAMGELAKFKNAQLSYFFGDFEWAQQQLKILKAASSDMIANDALYLSVLITENMPMDSNYTPLKRFAHADLLLHQNKTAEAKIILDSLLQHFPETALKDDLLMLQAKIAIDEGQYKDAVGCLELIYAQHKDDVLADDALLKLAQLNEDVFNNKVAAIKYYELIITEFPGSTYVQLARQKYALLQNAVKTKVQ